MRKILLLHLFLCALLLSCNNSKPAAYTVSEVVPYEKLLSKGIIPNNPNYKSTYPDILPYLYYNQDGLYKEIKGDFFSLGHTGFKEVNLMVGYWRKYNKYTNILLARVWIHNPDGRVVGPTDMHISSSEFGSFKEVKTARNPYRKGKEHLEQLFILPLPEGADKRILQVLADDVIRINVNGQDYIFLTPELTLE